MMISDFCLATAISARLGGRDENLQEENKAFAEAIHHYMELNQYLFADRNTHKEVKLK